MGELSCKVLFIMVLQTFFMLLPFVQVFTSVLNDVWVILQLFMLQCISTMFPLSPYFFFFVILCSFFLGLFCNSFHFGLAYQGLWWTLCYSFSCTFFFVGVGGEILMLCTPMSTPITIIVTTLTTHKIEIPWMVHHIQTKRLIYLQQCKNSSQKHKKSNICITKKTTKQNYVWKSQITKSDLISHKMGLHPTTNISNLFTPKLIWN
jgi:hypothetical protein